MSRVDIIVPSYNYGRFLRQCVESALSQSGVDVRVLIIDDASQDETPRVCAELVAEDMRVEVVRHRVNQGHITTYNEGIERARGDYLLVLSADDFLYPGALARAAAVLDADPEVGLAPGVYHFQRPGEPPPGGSPEVKKPMPLTTWTAIEKLARGNFVGTATAVARTSLQKDLGGYLPELPHAGDLEMWLRFALAAEITFVRTPQAVYRRHEANMSTAYDAQANFDQCVAAFRPHMDAIRGLAGLGPSLAIRIDEIFAGKAAALPDPDGPRPHPPFSFFPVRPPPPVGVILDARSGVETLVAAVRQALPRAEILPPADGAGWAALAASSPFDHLLVIDADIGPTTGQILALIRRLEAEPDRAHGLCGARLERWEGALTLRAPIVGLDGPVSFLTGVLAVSKGQVLAAQRLARRLGPHGRADPGRDDDILISCAGAKPPICHAIGEVTGLPDAVDARSFAPPFGDTGRGDVLEALLRLDAVATFKPTTVRAGPWGRRPQPLQGSPDLPGVGQ